MSKRYPVRIHRRDDRGAPRFRATTALEKLADAPEQLEAQLRDLVDAYTRALATAQAALADAKRAPRERTRAYWRVGQAIRDFETTLAAAGFYLVAQTATFARDLGVHQGSLRKVLAFHRQFPDAAALDPQMKWSGYRERRSGMTTIYTLGHSTRPLNNLIEMLRAHGITLLADIRTIPRSRHNPQFNRESLEQELPKANIQYRHLKELGGLRHATKDSINKAWENESFRGYADYMQTDEFATAIQGLIALAESEHVALMCSEGNPLRCHRWLVADALTVRGVRVLHISSRKSAKKHRLTLFARVEGTNLTYPKEEEE